MNNFYTNNAYDEKEFSDFTSLYDKTSTNLALFLYEYFLDRFLGYVGAYRTIQEINLDITPSIYLISDIASDDRISSIDYFKGKNVLTIISDWDIIPLEDKLSALYTTGHFLELALYSEGKDKGHRVVDMEIFTQDYRRLIRGVDFEINGGAIYILKEGIPANVIAKNVAVDCKVLDETYPDLFGIENLRDTLSQNDYIELLQQLIRLSLNGPTASGMSEAIKGIMGNEASVYDKYTKDISKIATWDRYAETPFDFVVEIPIDANPSYVPIMESFLKTLSPPESNYISLFIISMSDLYNATGKVILDFEDKITEEIIEIYQYAVLNSYFNDGETNFMNDTAYLASVNSPTESGFEFTDIT